MACSDVFGLYADPATWPEWGHNARWAQSAGPFVEGGTVDVRANYGKVYACRIGRLVPDRAVVLEVRTRLITVIQTYEVDERPAGSRVRHALELSGPIARIIQLFGAPWFYQRLLNAEVEKVIAMAGARRRPRADAAPPNEPPVAI